MANVPHLTTARNTNRPIPKRHWTARFLNLSKDTVDRADSFDFSQADVVYDLGDRGQQGKTAAELAFDFGLGSPPGVQSDYFALEAFTRIRLRKGRFYRLTSTSDDGVRFRFYDHNTDTALAEIARDWRDRSVNTPPLSQLLLSLHQGVCEFYIQYYERLGAAVLNIKLERIRVPATVVASNLNVRSGPSTLNTTILETLPYGSTIQLLRWMPSTTDPTYRHWYKIVTPAKQRGYVVMDARFVELMGDTTQITPIGQESLGLVLFRSHPSK